ncbi:hypothetical protein GCM10023322_68600 [Rugosimonospora acidiphila]|uniref:SnoaL-like domain-containing protein n=1 Tax=Rugosimonospora acidiphila TaxID=556531 RepID=A0ABP9SLW0_9ACTN
MTVVGVKREGVPVRGFASCLAVTLAVFTASSAAGCSSDSPSSAATPPVPTLSAPAVSSPSTDPSGGQVQQAVTAYMDLLHAFVAASNAGTTDTSDLSNYGTGTALQVLSDGLQDNKSKGVKSQGQPGIDAPQVTKISPADDPTSVTVTGCVDDTHWLLYTYDGKLADNPPSGRRGTSAVIDRSGSVWKVTSLAIKDVGTCAD